MKNERPHRKLVAWQLAMELYVDVFNMTQKFPREEIYGITSQLRRAALSVPSNVAEGAAKSSKLEFAKFLNIAEGSLSEMDTQIEAAFRVGYLSEAHLQSLGEKINRCSALIRGLKNKTKASRGKS